MDQGQMHYAQMTLAIMLVVVLALCGFWDAYASFSQQKWASVSSIIREWSAKMPAFPFIAGLLGGHLFLT